MHDILLIMKKRQQENFHATDLSRCILQQPFLDRNDNALLSALKVI